VKVTAWLPDWLNDILTRMEPLFPWLTGAGIAMALISMVALPWLLIRMPRDYFVAPERDPDRGPVAWLVWVVRNSLALCLVAAGILMLVLPGQGLLTILIGLMCSNFPGKYRLERRLVRYRSIFDAINWIRDRRDKPPILYPQPEHDP
jgi:hypothetical protein